MTIWLDKSKVLVVVKCTECPWWAAAAETVPRGWATGSLHEALMHPGVDQARKSARMTRRRSTK